MKAEPVMSFGKRLRQLREAAGLTREQLAEQAGLTASGIGALERGERQRPYPHTIRALATALGLSEEQREVFLMREFLDMPFKDIADVVGCPENTVKSRMRYALEKLKLELEEYADLAFKELGWNIVRYNIGGGENPARSNTMELRARVPGFQPEPGKWDWSADANQRWMLRAAVAAGTAVGAASRYGVSRFKRRRRGEAAGIGAGELGCIVTIVVAV